MSIKEQTRVGSGFATLRNGLEQKVEIWRSYLVIKKKSRRFKYCLTWTTSSLSFFLVSRAKCPRLANDHARVHSPY